MPHAYSTRPLTEDQVHMAYLLVEAAGSGVSDADWCAFCRRVTEWRGATGLYDDVFVATDTEGHIKGLFVTQTIQSMLFGRVLDIPLFIAASAGDEDGVISELLEAAKTKAREANCQDIRVWTQGGESWMRVTGDTPPESRYKGVQLRLV